MSDLKYSAQEALNIIIRKVKEASPELEERIQAAIDTGKDIRVSDDNTRKKKKNFYFKSQPFSDEEAIQVALYVLEAHLVENRMFAIKAYDEFQSVPFSVSKQKVSAPMAYEDQMIIGKNGPKIIEVERETETVKEKSDEPNEFLEIVDQRKLRSLQTLINKLRELTDFTGQYYADDQ